MKKKNRIFAWIIVILLFVSLFVGIYFFGLFQQSWVYTPRGDARNDDISVCEKMLLERSVEPVSLSCQSYKGWGYGISVDYVFPDDRSFSSDKNVVQASLVKDFLSGLSLKYSYCPLNPDSVVKSYNLGACVPVIIAPPPVNDTVIVVPPPDDTTISKSIPSIFWYIIGGLFLLFIIVFVVIKRK
jgi:hypothetical protein